MHYYTYVYVPSLTYAFKTRAENCALVQFFVVQVPKFFWCAEVGFYLVILVVSVVKWVQNWVHK